MVSTVLHSVNGLEEILFICACKVGFIRKWICLKELLRLVGGIHLYFIPYSAAVYFALTLSSVHSVYWSHFLDTNTRSGP